MTFFAGPTVSDAGEASKTISRQQKLAQRTASTTSRPQHRPQAAGSLTSWVKNIMPSRRPERGGTVRKRGYWEQAESVDPRMPKTRRRFTDSHHSLTSVTEGPDRIVRWNTAKDVSQSDSEAILPSKRAVSAGHQSANQHSDAHPWMWMPQKFQTSPKIEAPSLSAYNPTTPQAAEIPNGPMLEFSEAEAVAVAERRLSKARRLIEARRKVRQERRSLKESGDYLGVQGINPDTGELDIITPTDSDGSSAALEREQKLQALREKLQQARESKESATEAAREAKGILRELETKDQSSAQKHAIRELNKVIKWRRLTKQWSSAQEPNLSPIAQSRRSTMPASPAPQVDDDSTVPLIDVTSPKTATIAPAHRAVSFAEVSPHRTSASTPGSYGTIVRTPCRHSLANLSSAALELFNNGISFGPSYDDKDAVRRADLEHSKEKESHPEVPVSRNAGETPKVPADESGKGMKGSPMLSSEILFSEMGSRQERHPPDLLSTATEGTPTVPLLIPSGNLIGQHEDLRVSPTTLDPYGQARRGRRFQIVRRTMRTTLMQTHVHPDEEASQNFEPKGLRKWMPTRIRDQVLGQEGMQRVEANAARTQQDTKMLQPVRNRASPSLKHEQPQTGSSLGHLPILSPSRTTEMIRTKIKALGEGKDALESPAAAASEGQPQYIDYDWINRTMQEIAKCCVQNQDQHACMSITTTTGSDPETLQSSQKQNLAPAPAPELEGRYLSAPPSTKRAVSAENMKAGLAEFLPQTCSNSLPSSILDNEARAADTTSGRQLWAVKYRVARLVGQETTVRQGPFTTPQKQTGIRHTFTSTPTRRTAKDLGCSTRLGARLDLATYPRIGPVKSRKRARTTIAPVPVNLTKGLHRTVRTPARKQKDQTEKDHDQQTRMPGSYPEGESDDVVTADLFRSLVHEVQIHTMPRATLSLVMVLLDVACRAVKAYWAALEPMLDAKSEFRKRHARGRSNWGDCVRTLLAVPATIVALVMSI